MVGAPHGPLRSRDATRGFYDHLVQDVRTETMIPVRSYYGGDFCVIKHEWTGTVPGSFLGLDGRGRQMSFRFGCCTSGSSGTA